MLGMHGAGVDFRVNRCGWARACKAKPIPKVYQKALWRNIAGSGRNIVVMDYPLADKVGASEGRNSSVARVVSVASVTS